MRIIHLAIKDFYQILLDWKSFLFLLAMPIAFTLLFGFAFQDAGGKVDNRLPVVLLDRDESTYSEKITGMLEDSDVIRVADVETADEQILREMVSDGEIAGLVIIPQGYAQALENGESYQVSVVADESASSGTTIQSSVLTVVNRIHSAALTARLISASIEETDTDVYQSAFEDALASWKNPAITTVATETTVAVMEDDDTIENSFAHSSPGMILQFAIAGLIGAAGVVVREKETRTLQRMLTTNFPPAGVLLGHFLAMFLMIFLQVIVLMIFGQLFLDLNYLNAPLASLLLAVCTAACFGAMGLLIGALSKKEESAIVYSLVPMFIFAALGGAWVPLEFTSETVQLVGHFSPVAWGMDGFKDILIRGNGIETVWLPCLVLLGFGVLFFALGAWLFKFE